MNLSGPAVSQALAGLKAEVLYRQAFGSKDFLVDFIRKNVGTATGPQAKMLTDYINLGITEFGAKHIANAG